MTYCSVYEITDTITGGCVVPRKTHMWCWFSGDTLHPRWTTVCISGTNTFQMADVIDGGFEMITATSTGNGGALNFGGATNDPLHYCPAAVVLISVYQSTSAVTRFNSVGMSVACSVSSSTDFFIVQDDTCDCMVNLLTNDGSCPSTQVCTCCCHDACVHVAKFVGTACDITLAIDGTCVDATATTDLPNTCLAPLYRFLTRTTAARTFRTRYFEAFST